MCFRQASNDQTKNAIGWFFMLVIPLVRVFLKNHIVFLFFLRGRRNFY